MSGLCAAALASDGRKTAVADCCRGDGCAGGGSCYTDCYCAALATGGARSTLVRLRAASRRAMPSKGMP